MATEVQNPEVNTADANELARLRNANVDLLQAKHSLKARIEELEASNAALQTRATEAEQARHEALVGIPLKRMAELVSPVPALFLSEFLRHFKVDADKDGKLTIFDLEGKPALTKQGKPVEFTQAGLWGFLASEAVLSGGKKDERSKTFNQVMFYAGPSGTGAGGHGTGANGPLESGTKKAPKIVAGLGLR
jgi:hypothetical protein